jgi:hypothetical protein|tara:strand:+ start:454 stop:738 length:285 start_codon:yes stop_codon:yes gene_type:complete
MNKAFKDKTISFIGLFFFASISLHSFAHIDESPLSQETELECLTCHNEFSSDVEVYVFIPNENFPKLVDENLPLKVDLQDRKAFNSQAPPKISI